MINPQRRRAPEPKPILGQPDKPDSVKSDKVASQVWDSVCDQLEAMSILAKSDFIVIEMFCLSVSAYRRNIQAIAVEGDLLVTRNGEHINPRCNYVSKLMQTVNQLGSAMGLNPVARVRLAVAEPEPDDLLTAWLKESGEN